MSQTNSLRMMSTKSTISQKLKMSKEKMNYTKSAPEYYASFVAIFFKEDSKNFKRQYLKN